MQSELNKKLVAAFAISKDSNYAANECEKICLQGQIDLLENVFNYG